MLLKFLRNEKGVTQNDVTKAIGVARYTYAKWEQGRSEPCILDIIKLLNYFDCSFEDLVGETTNSNKESATKSQLNKMQTKLLSSFNLLAENDQNKVLGYINALLR